MINGLFVLAAVAGAIAGMFLWLERATGLRDSVRGIRPAAVWILAAATVPLLSQLNIFGYMIGFMVCIAILIGSRRRTFWATAGAIGAVVLMAIASVGGKELSRQWQELKDRHPVVSLQPRLDKLRPASKDAVLGAKSPPNETGEKGLDEARVLYAENRDDHVLHRLRGQSNRMSALQEIHSSHRDHFAEAAGFGPIRMSRISRDIDKYLEVDDRPPPVQPSNRPVIDESTLEAPPPQSTANAQPKKSSLNNLNALQQYAFSNDEQWGWVSAPGSAAGFVSHGFRDVCNLKEDDFTNWRIDRLELIGVLRHDEPRAYVTDKLPSMESIESIPTRRLDDFELASLAKLRTGDEIVTKDLRGALRMVGAIRAWRECLQCHAGKKNDLLGAFSYRLVPAASGAAGMAR